MHSTASGSRAPPGPSWGCNENHRRSSCQSLGIDRNDYQLGMYEPIDMFTVPDIWLAILRRADLLIVQIAHDDIFNVDR